MEGGSATMAHLRLMAMASAALAVGSLVATPAWATGQRIDAVPIAAEQQICSDIFGSVYTPPSSEPLAQCQWDMAIIHADASTRTRATGAGVRVGVIDSGIDLAHPDIVPNLDLAASCSF